MWENNKNLNNFKSVNVRGIKSSWADQSLWTAEWKTSTDKKTFPSDGALVITALHWQRAHTWARAARSHWPAPVSWPAGSRPSPLSPPQCSRGPALMCCSPQSPQSAPPLHWSSSPWLAGDCGAPSSGRSWGTRLPCQHALTTITAAATGLSLARGLE